MDADAIHARRAVEALRSGVPNRDAVRELGSAQAEIERRFRQKLDVARAGQAVGGLLVGGDFGSGKSHLLEYLQHLAVEDNFVASKIVISKETPLHDPVKVYRSATENAVVPGRHGVALTEVASSLRFDSEAYARFYRWANTPESGLNERFPASLYLFENQPRADREFADRIVRFWSGDPIGVGELKKKLRELGEAATWALSKVSQRDLALQRFRFASHMIQAAGFSGWVLLFDEVELIGHYSVLQRGKSYGEVARWVDGFELEPIEGLASILAGADDFSARVIEEKLDEERVPARFRDRGEEILASRAEHGMRIMRNPILLERPGTVALEQTQRKLRNIHARAYGWQPPELKLDLPHTSTRMREYVRAWINEWDLRRLYPEYRPQIEIEGFRMEYTEDSDLEKPPEDDGSGSADE